MLTALLPYVFLSYQAHIPSRQLYLASMGLVASLAVLLGKMDVRGLRVAFVVTFLAVNIGYIRWVKDAQFERRGNPTRQLLLTLQSRPAGPLMVSDFPDNPWIAKLVTRRVPGWDPQMLAVDDPRHPCVDCPDSAGIKQDSATSASEDLAGDPPAFVRLAQHPRVVQGGVTGNGRLVDLDVGPLPRESFKLRCLPEENLSSRDPGNLD